MVWVAYWNKQLGRLVFFPIGQPGNWYSTLHLNDGSKVDGDVIFKQYLPKEEPISYSRGLGPVWVFERNLLPRRAA